MSKSSALTRPINFSNHTFRSSSAGKLMKSPKGGSPAQRYVECTLEIDKIQEAIDNEKNKSTKRYTKNVKDLDDLKKQLPLLEKNKDKVILSETAISYLLEVYACVRYGITKEIGGKYLDSGKARENESIITVADAHDELYEKCTLPRRFNEFIEGECDILYPSEDPELVIDIKSSWDGFTFSVHSIEEKIENDIYEWQGICYCELYGVMKFKLCYVLVDMPDGIVQDELKRILYKFGSDKKESDEYRQACEDFIATTKYSHLPAKARVIEFSFDYDKDKYKRLCKTIEAARDWLNIHSIKEYERETGNKWDEVYEPKTLSSDRFVELIEVPVINLTVTYEGENLKEQVGEKLVEIFQSVVNDEKQREVVMAVDEKGNEFPVEVIATIISPTVDEEESDEEKEFKELQPLINACTSLDDLNTLANQNAVSIAMYQSIANEFSNKDKTLSQKPIKEEVLCPKCQSKDLEIHLDGGRGDFLCNDCGYDSVIDQNGQTSSIDELVNNAVEVIIKEETENLVREVIDETLSIKAEETQTEQELEPEPEPSSEEITDPILKEINALSDKMACIDYYTEKTSDFWEKNPNYYKALDEKKKSFIQAKLVEDVKKPDPKPTKQKETATSPVDQVKKAVFVNPVKEDPQPGDTEKINEFKQLYVNFTKIQEFRDLYLENREIIDRNKTFRDELDSAGKAMAEKIMKDTRKEVKDQISKL